MQKCVHCEKTSGDVDRFWGLVNYFGITGTYCGQCYTLVSHDSWGNPIHPYEYLMILLKQEKGNGKKT